MRSAAPMRSTEKGALETMDGARSVCRIEDDSRYEWCATTGLLASHIARDTALQVNRNGLEILVCSAEEFDEKGLPATYAAEECFTEGMVRLRKPQRPRDPPLICSSNFRTECFI